MAVYYAQILNKSTRKVLCGEFTKPGDLIRDDHRLLLEMKQATISIPSNSADTLYNINSQNPRYTLYLQAKEDLLFCFIADRKHNSNLIPAYSEALFSEFSNKYSDFTATHYEFADRIKEICTHKNKNERLSESIDELNNVRSILVENLGSVVHRGEDINNLRDLADRVNSETKELSRKANHLRTQAQMEKYKVYGIIFLFFMLVLYLFWR